MKELKPRIVPVGDDVFDLYAEYMEIEYGALDCETTYSSTSSEHRSARR